MDIEKYVIRQARIVREYCDYRYNQNLSCNTCILKLRSICTTDTPVSSWDVSDEYEGID